MTSSYFDVDWKEEMEGNIKGIIKKRTSEQKRKRMHKGNGKRGSKGKVKRKREVKGKERGTGNKNKRY